MEKKVIIKNGSWVTDRPDVEKVLAANAVELDEMKKILRYEVYGSWWASFIFAGWMQKLSGSYFAWKVNRKYNRYKKYNGSKKS